MVRKNMGDFVRPSWDDDILNGELWRGWSLRNHPAIEVPHLPHKNGPPQKKHIFYLWFFHSYVKPKGLWAMAAMAAMSHGSPRSPSLKLTQLTPVDLEPMKAVGLNGCLLVVMYLCMGMFMNFSGCSWVFMDVHGFSWILIGVHRFSCV